MRSPLTIAAMTLTVMMPAAAMRQSSTADVVRPVLPASLGSLHHSILTESKDAQTLFDQGLTLYYGFNRDAARRSFAAASQADPNAAMAHVGVALALGPNLNMESTTADIRAACDASRRASTLSRNDGERGYAGALTARYCDTGGARLNAQRYVEAMRELHHALPNDLDAAVLYADSLLALRPRAVTQEKEIISLLEAVIQRQPDHVGANHYYIHTVEGTSTPERGLASARRLETLVPGVGHLLHMPSHIYMRTGGYEASILLNRRAAAADLAYLRANPPGHDGVMYYFHDLESLAVAAGYAGRFGEARTAALEIARVEAELAGERPGTRFSGPLAMVLLRFQRWPDISALPLATESDPTQEFLSRFARAVAFAALRQLDKARPEADACFRALSAIPYDAYYRSNRVSAIRPVFEAVIAARFAAASSDSAGAVRQWERALAAEEVLEYHEPPPFYYPIRESLGAALVAAGRPADAERVFREELVQHPGSGRALFGLWHVLRARRAGVEAEQVHRAFLDAWAGSDFELSLARY